MQHDRSRTMFASEQMRHAWEWRFRRAATLAWRAGFESVGAQRSVAMDFVEPRQYPAFLERYGQQGFVTFPLTASEHGFVLVARPDSVPAFMSAWRAHDEERLGVLLGYPLCCVENFLEHWKAGTDMAHHMRSYDVPYARQTPEEWATDAAFCLSSVLSGQGPTGRERKPLAPFVSNPLLRTIGARYIWHLPCSLDCPASARLAWRHRALFQRLDREGADILDEILSWPMLWSAHHGVLEIETPVCKIQGTTEYTAKEFRIEVPGTVYPVDAPNGVRFPYGGAPRALPRGMPDTSWRWRMNGFYTPEAMRDAHAMFGLLPWERSEVVCDLGAGTGALMASLPVGCGYGVEIDPERVHASETPSVVDDNFTVERGRLQEYQIPADVTTILLCPVRLEEAWSDDLVAQFKGRRIVIYAYGDNLPDVPQVDGNGQPVRDANGYPCYTRTELVDLCRRAGLDGYLDNEQRTAAGAVAEFRLT